MRPHQSVLFVALILFAVIALLATSRCESSARRQVLLLNSYHAGLTWTDNIVQGVRQAFPNDDRDVELHIEYLDSKRHSGAAYEQVIVSLFQEKYRHTPLQAVICSDDDALSFLLRHRSELFSDSPVIFCGINFLPSYGPLPASKFTGVVEDFDIPATLTAMLQLQPQTREVFVVNDQSATGRANVQAVQQAAAAFQNRLTFRFSGDLTMDALCRELAMLPADTIVLLMTFNRDQAGNTFDYNESIQRIAASSVVPLYGVWDFYLDHGIVGGMLTDGLTQGRLAAEKARRILDGVPVAEVPVLYESPNRYMFDDNELRRFQLNKTALPAGSLLINEPPSFYAQHRVLVWTTLVIVLLLLAAILALLYILQIQKRAELEIRRSEEKFSTAFHQVADSIGIVRLSDQVFLNVNTAFCRLFGYSAADIIGHTSRDFSLWADSADRVAYYQEIENSPHIRSREVSWLDRNGATHIGLFSSDLLMIDRQRCILFILHDITERKAMEAELQRSYDEMESNVELRTQELSAVNQELRASNEELEGVIRRLHSTQQQLVQSEKLAATALLVVGIAHEINTPLGCSVTAISHLQRELAALDLRSQENRLRRADFSAAMRELCEAADLVMNGLQRVSFLIHQFKQLSDFDQQETSRCFPVKEYLRIALRDIPADLKQRAEIELQIDDTLTCNGFPGSFAQVVMQLLLNALQHAFPVKSGHVRIRAFRSAQELQLIVEDDGCGIAAEHLPKIFDPFFTTARSQGPGLGLHIVHNVVTLQFHGSIRCSSTPEHGSIFHLSIPQ